MTTRSPALRLVYGGLVAAGIACAGCGPPGPRQLRLTHSAPTDHPNHVAVTRMAERVETRTSGAIRLAIFPANELGSPPETADQVRLGVIDLGLVSPAQLDKFNPAFGVVFIPYQFDDYAHAHRTLDETAADWLGARAREIGFVLLANFEWGFRVLTNGRHPVRSPADIRGLKLRVPPEIQIKATMEALGAITHTIAFQEVYAALATGTVDGQDNPIAATYTTRIFEVQDHLAVTNHVYAPMMLVAHAATWASLPEAERAILEEEAVRAGAEARRAVQEEEAGYLGEMERAGVATTYPEMAPFRALMEPAHAAIRQFVGAENWDSWHGFVEAARHDRPPAAPRPEGPIR